MSEIELLYEIERDVRSCFGNRLKKILRIKKLISKYIPILNVPIEIAVEEKTIDSIRDDIYQILNKKIKKHGLTGWIEIDK